MPRSCSCSFCGKQYPPASGTSYIRNDGSILYFCSNKCRKSQLDLKRDPRKLKWTEHYAGQKK